MSEGYKTSIILVFYYKKRKMIVCNIQKSETGDDSNKFLKVDLLAEWNITKFYALIINQKTKGVFYEEGVTSGEAMMNIEQERHSVHANLDKKKCYFMLHWSTDSDDFKFLESNLVRCSGGRRTVSKI